MTFVHTDPTTASHARNRGFSARLCKACDEHSGVPDLHKGRLNWIKREVSARLTRPISVESVRKWLNGETTPRPEKLKQLAAVLDVSEAWLAFGDGEREPSSRWRKPSAGRLINESTPKDRGTFILERIRAELGGTVTIAPGVDITAPTGEVWDAERD